MSNAVVTAWQACIRELQRLASTAGGLKKDDCEAFFERVEKLEDQAMPPHAAWKRLVQDDKITSKLAHLCLKVLQKPGEPSLMPNLAFSALNAWLAIAVLAMRTSPASRAAGAVRRQLQDSGLPQHLSACMDAAAVQLTAAVAALAAAAAATPGCSSHDPAAEPLTTLQDSIEAPSCHVNWADVYSTKLLLTYELVSSVLSPEGVFKFEAALPAAPGAVRLMLGIYQAHSGLQQLKQQQQLPWLVKGEVVDLIESGKALHAIPKVVFNLASSMTKGRSAVLDTLPSCPGANELLLLPEFASCLACMLVVTVLGWDTSTCRDSDSVAAAPVATRRKSMKGSRTSPQVADTQQQKAVSSGSNVSSGDGSDRTCGNGVSLDSLTPLSCSVFDLLGMSKETALQAAREAKQSKWTAFEFVTMMFSAYTTVVEFQVHQAKGAFSPQLMLQLETDMLLTLAVLQLTAGIPDSYPGARSARELAYRELNCGSLYNLWDVAGLHKLPRPAAYTGPQLALQLLPSPPGLQQPSPLLPQPGEQGQLPSQPSDGWCVLAPSPSLLTQLLPLVTRFCIQQLLQHQLAAPFEWPIEVQVAMMASLLCLRTLLFCSVVPAPGATTSARGSSPQPATAGEPAKAQHYRGQVTCSCVMHAQDALMPHVCAILSIFEAFLRHEAVHCGAVGPSGSSGSAGASGYVSTKIEVTGMAAAASGDARRTMLDSHASEMMSLCGHYVLGGYPHYPSPMAMLAIAAGPGSQVQCQLHSLLASMQKLSTPCTLGVTADGRRQFRGTAALAASSLLAGAAEQLQQRVGAVTAAAADETDYNSGPAAAAVMLPSVVVLGRYFMQWAEEQLTDVAEEQEPGIDHSSDGLCSIQLDDIMSAVQQWLAAGSTCDQLAAAGYEPVPVLLQLEQRAAARQALQDSPADSAAQQAQAQELRSIGLALCSFAVPCMCNNPGCTSMAGLSELATVSGRSCICGGCRVARYCGRACQRAAWKQHKPVCAALNAAAAALTEAGSAAGAAV